LELMMIWQLLQVRHLDVPLILVGKMWRGLVDWARTSLASSQPRLVSPEDMDIPRCVDGADEALDLIREHHAQWLRSANTGSQ
jgi:predicted Rossmann-fold nucleotide-binding protein